MSHCKTDWLFQWKSGYLGCRQTEETALSHFTLVLETNCIMATKGSWLRLSQKVYNYNP